MQLFILDRDPEVAASMLCDSHLRKMCLETAQILSSIMTIKNISPESGMPKAYNLKHPVITALETPYKIDWIVLHNIALHREYIRRFGKEHSYMKLAMQYKKYLFSENAEFDDSFCRNFKDFQSPHQDIVAAYRSYYIHKKSIMKKWSYTNAAEPVWLKNQ